jgi:threonine/homoserine/homoserine lactone efflux protein
MFLDRSSPVATSLQIAEARPLRAFLQSIMVEALNPKTAIFFLAFLPQFTDPGAAFPIWLQLLVLGTIVNLVFTSADIVCVLLADRVSAVLHGSRSADRLAKRLGGTILIGLGVNVAFNRQ